MKMCVAVLALPPFKGTVTPHPRAALLGQQHSTTDPNELPENTFKTIKSINKDTKQPKTPDQNYKRHNIKAQQQHKMPDGTWRF